MSFTKESTLDLASKDLAKRLGVDAGQIKLFRISDWDFPDSSLGSPVEGEMAAMMISSGWQIELKSGGNKYDYRADKYQMRLHNFEGKNYVIET